LEDTKSLNLVREVALKVLYETNHKGKYANISLKRHLRLHSFNERDIHLITKLVYGTLEKQITIDWVVKKFTDTNDTNPWIKNILRMGCYQIIFLEKIPDSAACNESVKLCKAIGYPGLSGFINAVLRKVARKKHELGIESINGDDPLSLSLRHSYPEWLVGKWIEDFGIDYTRKIITLAEQDDYTSIRVNTLKTDADKLKKSLEDSGIHVSSGLYMKDALKIMKAGDIERHQFYKDGLFTVQDESSMLVVKILDPHPGDVVLDACAAPGGKSTYISEKMANMGQVFAWDIHEQRVGMITKNAARMGSSIIYPAKQDACDIIEEYNDRFDRVLADVPCSGLGVSHKKPDIKLKIEPEGINSMLEVQWRVLSNVANYVKTGGVLVYSTCTINADENQRMVAKFLTFYKNFEIEPIEDMLPEVLHKIVSPDGTIQLIPSRDFIDGFFIARLRRMK